MSAARRKLSPLLGQRWLQKPMRKAKRASTEVYDALGMLRQLGAVPAAVGKAA